jgi:hypothetical protein
MKFLKFIYRNFVSGIPLFTYNLNSEIPFHAPFKVMPESLYINYKLNLRQRCALNSYIKQINPNLYLEPVKINIKDKPKYYISLNIYNCTSPVFMNTMGMTRFEINTYVNNGITKGTLIIDYLSNSLSMDPVNIYKKPVILNYNSGKIFGKSKNIILNTSVLFSEKDLGFLAHSELARYTDYIYYSNGIYDKLYYDPSLTNAILKVPQIEYLDFTFLNITFQRPDSVFYFKDSISFVTSMWDNIFKE